MQRQSILDLAFNLGMNITIKPTGEIIIETGLKYDNDTVEPDVVKFEIVKPVLKLLKGN